MGIKVGKIYFLILLVFVYVNEQAFGRSHPGRSKKTHNNNNNNRKKNLWKNNAVPISNLTFIGEPAPQTSSMKTIKPLKTVPIKTSAPTPTTKTTKAISFNMVSTNNQTFHNLENTLENISPNPFSETPPQQVDDTSNFSSFDNATSKNSTTSNMLEVINIVPYFKGRSKYSKKFAMIVTLYGVLTMSCIFMAACLIRGIHKRNQRHRQYVLLTKRDFDYPVGGGGI